MLDALYPEEWYNNENYTSDELGYVLHENRLLGAARLRQVGSDDVFRRRRTNWSCAGMPKFVPGLYP